MAAWLNSGCEFQESIWTQRTISLGTYCYTGSTRKSSWLRFCYKLEGRRFESRMRWIFSFYLIFPSAIWPRVRRNLLQKWVPGIFLGVKGDRCIGLTTLPPSVSLMSDIVGASKSRNPNSLHVAYGDNCTFTLLPVMHCHYEMREE
jgi:hypothetical protein